MGNKSVAALLVAASMLFATPAVCADAATAGHTNDYPTATRVDYVIGCMAANGQTVEMLHKCSCSIDYLASIIPYADYEQIETIMQLQQMPGVGRNAVYRNSNWSKGAVAAFKEAQADSTLRCF